MEIIQCTLCRKPFQSYGSKSCFECTTYMEESMKKIRDYLDEHPRSGAEITSYHTGVPLKLIMHLLKDGRLFLVEDDFAISILSCESCKKAISTGRLCDECRQNLQNSMQEKIGTTAIKPDDSTDFKAAKIEN